MNTTHKETPVVVVGLCSHGLATVRALAQAGIEVHALEANPNLPGAKTKYATVHLVDDINDAGLIENLISVKAKHLPNTTPVLMVTNDKMVGVIGRNVEYIKGEYHMVWQDQRDTILRLIDKTNLEQRCETTGLNYPRTRVIQNPDDLPQLQNLRFPLIAKPSKPLSSFKTHKLTDLDSATAFLEHKHGDWPILVQEWVDGNDESIFFCALYIAKNHAIQAVACGQKIESYPKAMGQTVIAKNVSNPTVEALTKSFFHNIPIRGPVSLELKVDADGQYWVIEPTLGRTDFWLDLVTESGINLPLLEYCDATGQARPNTQPLRDTLWLDTEKDPTAYWRHVWKTKSLRPYSSAPVFAYLGHADNGPSVHAFWQLFERQLNKFTNLKQQATAPVSSPGPASANTFSVDIYTTIAELPEETRGLLQQGEQEDICLSEFWFRLYEQHILTPLQRATYVLVRKQGKSILLFPLSFNKEHHKLVLKLTGLSNFYTTHFGPIICTSITDDLEQVNSAIQLAIDTAFKTRGKPDQIELQPMSPDAKWYRPLIAYLNTCGFESDSYFVSENWVEDVSDVDYETYLSNRPSVLKNTLKRRQKKMDREQSWSFTVIRNPEDVADAFEDYLTIYRQSWKKPEPFPLFLKNVATEMATRGWLRLCLLHIDDKPAAAQIWCSRDGRCSVLKLAHSESFAAYSPGSLLTNYIIQYFFEHDAITHLDFLMGNDSYKKLWMKKCNEKTGIEAVNQHSIIGKLILMKRRYLDAIKKQ